MMNYKNLKIEIKDVDRILKNHYGIPSLSDRKRRRPLEEIIITILSQNTTDKNSYQAFLNLKSRYRTMEELSKADLNELADTIRIGGLGPTKARYILGLFSWLKDNRGSIDCDFMCDMETDEAIETFTKIKGIGVKTIAVVLAFSCGVDIFPVDTHVFRVSKRIGILPGVESPAKAFYFLRDLIPRNSGFSMHMNVIKHGREICLARSPKCEICFLNRNCRYYMLKFAPECEDK